MRKSRKLTKTSDIEYFLNITYNDYTRTFIMETFGIFNGKSRYNPYDLIDIPPGNYGNDKKKNKNTFTTTVGIWVFNKFIIEKDLFDIFGYINEVLTKKKYKSMLNELTTHLLEDRVDIKTYKKFITNIEFLMSFVSILSPNDTDEILTISDKINPKKEKLFKQNKEEFENGNALLANQIEDELINDAIKHLEDDPSLDSYLSGARGNIGNHFKNTYVMKGAMRDPITNKFNIASSNYSDGIKPDEYAYFANSLAAGPYKRANKTMIGGYWEKLFEQALQHVKVLPPGSDCGTDKYIVIKLDNPSECMYSYIIENGKLVQLNSTNVDKYKGKTVKMRFASLCKAKPNGCYCSKCAGDFFNMVGLTNVGLATPIIPSKLKNISMKSFHDSTEKFRKIDLSKAFGFDGNRKIR